MVPRTRGEWIVGPCTSALETPSPCPGCVNQCTPSYTRARYQSPRPPPVLLLLLHLHHHQHHRRRGQPLLYILSLVLFLAAAVTATPPLLRPGEGWVRGCRRRPATALCISHRAATNFHSLPLGHSFFSLLPLFPSSVVLRSFSMPTTTFSRSSSYRERESFSSLKSFSSSRELTFLLITRPASVSVERVGLCHCWINFLCSQLALRNKIGWMR